MGATAKTLAHVEQDSLLCYLRTAHRLAQWVRARSQGQARCWWPRHRTELPSPLHLLRSSGEEAGMPCGQDCIRSV